MFGKHSVQMFAFANVYKMHSQRTLSANISKMFLKHFKVNVEMQLCIHIIICQ